MDTITKTELAYAAGFFDGEGSIGIAFTKNTNGKRYHRLMISIVQTDPRPLLWIKARFGGYMGTGKMHNLGRKLAYTWQSNSQVAEDFLRTIRPYLIVKAEQADIALAFRETKRNTRAGMVHGRKGQSKDPVTPALEAEREVLRNRLMVLTRRGTGEETG